MNSRLTYELHKSWIVTTEKDQIIYFWKLLMILTPKFLIRISTTCVFLERFKPELHVKNKMKKMDYK